MDKTKILIDTDPGNDDLLAIVMALSSIELDLKALTIVGGNASLEDTTDNALSLLSYMGRLDVPVYVGHPSAMNETLTSSAKLDDFKSHRSRIHGETGLHVDLPRSDAKPESTHAVDLIISELEANKGELVLVPIGPLTNIAMAIKKEPRIIEWAKSVHVMGGAVNVPGNITKSAEFNIYCDPVAANEVFSSGLNIKLCGLDITRETSVKRGEVNWLNGDSPGELLIRQLLDIVFTRLTDRNSFSLHDPIAVLSVLHPELIQWKTSHIAVICDGEEVGKTCDLGKPGGSVEVGVGIDQDLAKTKIAEILGTLKAQ